MKVKTLYLLGIAVIVIFVFSGCSNSGNQGLEVEISKEPESTVKTDSFSGNQGLKDEISKEPDSTVKTESFLGIKPLIKEDTTKYEYAKMSDSFTIENHDVLVKLEYDVKTNTFLGTINNNTDKNISNMVIDIIYSSGNSVTKKIYTEIIPGQMKIACLGSYVDPYQWRIEFSFGEGGSLRASGENSNIEIKHVGDIIPDDGLVVDGFRYASKSQNYFFENDVIKLSANFIGSRNWFKVYIENKTDKDLEGIDFGVKMLGAKRTDWTMNMTVRADIPRMMKVYSFEQIFKLWKPVLINTTTGIDMVTDDNGDLEVFNPSSPIANKTEVSNSKDEIVSDWPELIPIDIPHFNSGEMKIYTNFEDEKTVRVTLSFRKIELNYMKDYTDEIRAAGFDEFIKSDSEKFVIREYHRGDETLYLDYSIEYEDLKYI